MCRNDEIKSLLLSIRDVIGSKVKKDISLDQIKDQYKKLLTQYSRLKENYPDHKSKNYIPGLLYNHNCSNFSKISAIYQFSDNALRKLFHYGDESLLEFIPDPLLSEAENSEGDSEFKVNKKIISMNDQSFNLFFGIIDFNDMIIIPVSVSSSYYYSVNRFEHLCRIIKEIYNKTLNELKLPGSIDYFKEISDEVNRFIGNHLKNNRSISAYVYIFQGIEKIFNNSSLLTLTDLSSKLTDTIKNAFGNESRVFTLSLKHYLILTPGNKDPGESKIVKGKRKRIFFEFNDLPVPYESIELDIEKYDSIYNLWEEIFIIDNYLSTGDITL